MRTGTKKASLAGLGRAVCVVTVIGSCHGASAARTYPLPWPKPAIETVQDATDPPLPLDKPVLDAVEEGTPPPGAAPAAPPLPLEKPQPAADHEEEQDAAPEPEEESQDEPAAWSDTQIADARARCREVLAGLAITYREVDTIGHAEGCGIAAPIEVSQLGSDYPVEISVPAMLNCEMAAALGTWVETVLQPAAIAEYEAPVVRMQNASAYACRRRNNKPAGKLSEHALGNAFDVSAFFWEDGSQVTVKDGWPGVLEDLIPDADARFLKALHAGACTVFSTILGPEANSSHEDHFHFDLGRGGRYLICE